MKRISSFRRLIDLSCLALKGLLEFARPLLTLVVALLCLSPIAFRSVANAQAVDETEVFSKFVGTWDVKCIQGRNIIDGSSEISLTDANWLEECRKFDGIVDRTIIATHSFNDTFEGVDFVNVSPFFVLMKGKLDLQANTITFECHSRIVNTGEAVKSRWVWSIPNDESFSITIYDLKDDGSAEETCKFSYLRRTKLPAAKPEAQDAEPDEKLRNQLPATRPEAPDSVQDEEPRSTAKRPTPDELKKYLGDWEVVSELSTDGLELPVSSEGVEPPGGDAKTYMRVRSDYLSGFGWHHIGLSEGMIKEGADEVEWTEIDADGIHGELYMTFEGVRKHVRSCVMKVTGKRALLRMDQAPRRVKDPFKLLRDDDLYHPTITSMIRADNLNAKDKK